MNTIYAYNITDYSRDIMLTHNRIIPCSWQKKNIVGKHIELQELTKYARTNICNDENVSIF